MPTIIYVTGKESSGKSCAVRKVCTETGASHIEIDEIARAGSRVLISIGGESRSLAGPGNSADWDRWENASEQERLDRVRHGLRSVFPNSEYRSPKLIVEGALLCKPSFHNSFRQVIRELRDFDATEHFLFLNLSNAGILANIFERNREKPHRTSPGSQLKTTDEVAQYHAGFDAEVDADSGQWTAFKSFRALVAHALRIVRDDR